jgi:hypothetical protein
MTILNKKKGQNLNKLETDQYLDFNYFEAWIANLGVVPLFLFDAFLLAPALFFFAALLLLVTLVLETINKLLSRNIVFKYNKIRFLSFLGKSVKEIVRPLSFVALISVNINAESLKTLESFDQIMAIGEIKIIETGPISKFLITNKDIIKYQYSPKNQKITIKAKKLGPTTIQLFDKNGEKQNVNIFVINKTKESKLLGLSEIFNRHHLKVTLEGDHLVLKGVIDNTSDYFSIFKLINQNQDVIINELTYSLELKHFILSEIIKELLEHYYDTIECHFKAQKPTCFIPENTKIHEDFKKYLKDKFEVNFINKNLNSLLNYQVKIKFIQIEKLDGSEFKFGIDQLNSSIGEILNGPLVSIIEKNIISLKKNNIELQTLANPNIIAEIKTPVEIQVGSELQINEYNRNNHPTKTDWKFTGLQIKLELENILDKIKIRYETQLSHPSNDQNKSIDGSKEKSSAIINFNTPTKLFEITLKTKKSDTQELPFFSKIPLIGALFKSKADGKNYKTIIGLIEIKPNE